jgi:hypothetical protein
MRVNFTAVNNRQGHFFRMAKAIILRLRCYLDFLECQERAFELMAANFLSAASPESANGLGKRKRISEDFVPFSCRTRSQGPLPPACGSLLVPRARKRTKLHETNVCSGVKNVGRTCYIGSALRLALSVLPWKSVRFWWLKLRLADFYCILYSGMPKFYGTQLRFRILLPSSAQPGIA